MVERERDGEITKERKRAKRPISSSFSSSSSPSSSSTADPIDNQQSTTNNQRETRRDDDAESIWTLSSPDSPLDRCPSEWRIRATIVFQQNISNSIESEKSAAGILLSVSSVFHRALRIDASDDDQPRLRLCSGRRTDVLQQEFSNPEQNQGWWRCNVAHMVSLIDHSSSFVLWIGSAFFKAMDGRAVHQSSSRLGLCRCSCQRENDLDRGTLCSEQECQWDESDYRCAYDLGQIKSIELLFDCLDRATSIVRELL